LFCFTGFDYIWSYSKAILGIFQFSSSSNISVGIFTVYCAVQWDQYQKFLLYTLTPVVGSVGVALFFLVKYMRENKDATIFKFFESHYWKNTASTLLVFLFILHPTLTQQIFQIFQCSQYGNQHFLSVDLSISCDGDEYQRWRAAAIGMILLYVVGIPAVGFSIVFYYRKHLDDPTVKQRFKFLYEGYAKNVYFWEFVIIVRKVVLVAIVVFLQTQNFRSVLAGIWLLIFALLVHVWASPFQSRFLEILETMALFVLLATLLFGIFALAPGFSEGEQTFSAVMVIGMNLVVTVILVGILGYLYYNMIAKHPKIDAFVRAARRYIDSRRSRAVEDFEDDADLGEEMAEIDNKYYYNRNSATVTADSLRQGRAQFNLKMDTQLNLGSIQLGRPPYPTNGVDTRNLNNNSVSIEEDALGETDSD